MRYKRQPATDGDTCFACQQPIQNVSYRAPDGLLVCSRPCAIEHHKHRDGYPLGDLLEDICEQLHHPDADPKAVARQLGLADPVADLVPLVEVETVLRRLITYCKGQNYV